MAKTKGSDKVPLKKKAEILVVYYNESLRIACQRYGINKQSIYNWLKELESNEELKQAYEQADYTYRKDLLTPTEIAVQVLANRAIDIGIHGSKYKGELREVREALQTFYDAVMNLRDEKSKEEIKREYGIED